MKILGDNCYNLLWKNKIRAINGDANVSGHEKVEDPLNPGRGNRSRNNSWSSPEKNSSCSSQ
jgi:hypothetical protein